VTLRGKPVGFGPQTRQQLRISDHGLQQELSLLRLGQQSLDIEVQSDLLVPWHAGHEVVDPVARLAPGAVADQQPPEADTKASRPFPVVERHQVVFAELTKSIEKESDVRQEQPE